jgi:hypothetical protein
VPKDAKEAKKIAKRTDCDPTNLPTPPAPLAAPSAANTAAKQFPFPGEQPAKPADTSAAKAFPYPGDSPAASLPASPAKQFPYPAESSGTDSAPAQAFDPNADPGRANPNIPYDPVAEKKAADTPAGKAFPYPGDPVPTAAPASSSSAPESPSSSSSSSTSNDDEPAAKPSSSKTASSDDDDDDQPQLTDKGSEGKRNKKTVKAQTDDDRVDEDLSVAKFYGQSGNAMGAYLRAKDAVKTEPDLPEARFVMGEAARRMKKTDEAKAEFTEYLKLSPDGEHAKAAEKALAELQ